MKKEMIGRSDVMMMINPTDVVCVSCSAVWRSCLPPRIFVSTFGCFVVVVIVVDFFVPSPIANCQTAKLPN